MVDVIWPADLAPYKVAFYLRPHIGGTQSPITRTKKVYGLSAPQWVARLTFRGGYDTVARPGDGEGFGPRLDALIVEMEGGLNPVALHDFRRPAPLRPIYGQPVAASAVVGQSTMQIAGFAPHAVAFSVGDYVGGDGRPHLLTGGAIRSGVASIMADAAGVATVSFKPPLAANIAAGTTLQWPVYGRFRLISEDAGENEAEVGLSVNYVLEFEEVLA